MRLVQAPWCDSPRCRTTRYHRRARSQSASLNSQYFSAFVSDSTDADGHAAVLVELGSVAGKAGILITVPELGLSDTAWYTVQPGRPAQLMLGVRDTVVTLGPRGTLGST